MKDRELSLRIRLDGEQWFVAKAYISTNQTALLLPKIVHQTARHMVEAALEELGDSLTGEAQKRLQEIEDVLTR